LRPHLAALAAFRAAAFGPRPEGERRSLLDALRSRLDGTGGGDSTIEALGRTLSEFGIDKGLLFGMLDAAGRDCGAVRFKDPGEVLEYCRLKRGSAGRFELALHGCRDEEALRLCDSLAAGLELADILRRLGSDIKLDRVYLPLSDFSESGYSEADLRMGVVNERFRNLAKLTWKRALAAFDSSEALARRLPRPLGWRYRLAWMGGTELLRKVHRSGYDTIYRSVGISRWEWAGMTVKAWVSR
jgi:phytoene/squalene synthetase